MKHTAKITCTKTGLMPAVCSSPIARPIMKGLGLATRQSAGTQGHPILHIERQQCDVGGTRKQFQ